MLTASKPTCSSSDMPPVTTAHTPSSAGDPPLVGLTSNHFSHVAGESRGAVAKIHHRGFLYREKLKHPTGIAHEY